MALRYAIQAAWAWTMRESGYGAPFDADSLEGWIIDLSLRQIASPAIFLEIKLQFQ